MRYADLYYDFLLIMTRGWWTTSRRKMRRRLARTLALVLTSSITAACVDNTAPPDGAASRTIPAKAPAGRHWQMTWVDRNGARVGTIGQPDAIVSARLSPDQKRVAFIVGAETAGRAWVLDAAGGVATPVTQGPTASSLAWTPDSTRLALNDAGPPARLYVTTLTGNRTQTGLAPTGLDLRVDDWSADGRWIVYEQDGQQKKTDLWLVALSSEDTPMPAASSEGPDRDAAFSPNNGWIAYVRDEAGRSEIMVQTYPVPSPPIRISREGGTSPRWSRDGREVFFQSLDGRLMTVAVAFEPGLSAAEPRTLFDLRDSRFQQPSADGQRFLLLVPVD